MHPLGNTGAPCTLNSAMRVLRAKQRAHSLSWSSLVHFISAFGYILILSFIDKWTNLTPLAADVCYDCGTELARGASLPYEPRSSRRKISPPPHFFRLEVNSCHQGIYPTTIFVVVTMRMSTADILIRSGPEPRHHPPIVIFAPPPPITQLSALPMTFGSSSDSDSFLDLCESMLTRTLASSDPEK